MKLRAGLALVLALILTSNFAKAQIFVSNLNTNLPDSGGQGVTYNELAQSFTLPAGQNYSLGSIGVNLFGSNGSYQFSLFSNNGGVPGSSLLTFSSPSVLATANYTLTANGSYTLTGGTPYWIVFGASTSSLYWGYSEMTPYGLAGATLGNEADSSAGWNAFSFLPYRYSLQVNGQAVPEPQSFALFFLAVVALGGASALRRKAN